MIGLSPLLVCVRYPLMCTDLSSSVPPLTIAGNTLTDGSSINVSVVVAAGQGSGGDPRLSQVSSSSYESTAILVFMGAGCQ